MRNAAFQRRMTRLALAAMLLLALLPTAGRLLAARSHAFDGTWAQMCTMSGLKLVKIAPDGPSNPAIPKPGDHTGASDCPYCPLANAIVALVLWVALVSTTPALRSWSWQRMLPPIGRRHPCGLGSRGPPGTTRISV